METTKLLIVEAIDLQRLGLVSWFEHLPQFELIAAVATAREANVLLDSTSIEMVLLDLDLPQRQGLELLRYLTQTPELRVVALTSTPTEALACVAVQLGVNAFASKAISSEQLTEILEWTRQGKSWVEPSVARAVLDRAIQQQNDPSVLSTIESPFLTSREQQVLDLMAEGYDNARIAGELYIALATVKTYVRRILDKFVVSDRTQAVVKGYRLGLVK